MNSDLIKMMRSASTKVVGAKLMSQGRLEVDKEDDEVGQQFRDDNEVEDEVKNRLR